jgi:hypothetical protein
VHHSLDRDTEEPGIRRAARDVPPDKRLHPTAAPDGGRTTLIAGRIGGAAAAAGEPRTLIWLSLRGYRGH